MLTVQRGVWYLYGAVYLGIVVADPRAEQAIPVSAPPHLPLRLLIMHVASLRKPPSHDDFTPFLKM